MRQKDESMVLKAGCVLPMWPGVENSTNTAAGGFLPGNFVSLSGLPDYFVLDSK